MSKKCIVCKTANIADYVRKHPDREPIWLLNYFMRRIRKRHGEDVKRICETHRVPLQLTSALSHAGNVLSKANEDPRLLLLESIQ